MAISDLAEPITVEQREELLALLLAEERVGEAAAAPELELGRRDARQGQAGAGEGAPLSFAQHRLWLLDQMVPGNPAYNIAVAVRLRGRLQVAALRWALDAIVARHEALRTVFPARRGEPWQRIEPSVAVPLPLVDLSALRRPDHRPDPAGAVSPSVPLGESAALPAPLVELAGRPFDLAAGPLLRLLLVRLEPEEHLFLAAAHHIVADGWSMGILTGELAALYNACLDGPTAPTRVLPPLPIQYADYAAWQRERLAGEALAGDLAYWRGRLAGPLPVACLPRRGPRPARQTFAGAGQPLAIAPALRRRLQELAQEAGTTLFAALCTGFAALLHRYTGQTDVVLGTAVAGRDHPETERLIGFFVNTLVLRHDLAGDPGFRQLLARAGPSTVEALAHQELPFDKLVEALHPERRSSHAPIFQILLVYEGAPPAMPALRGLRLTRLPLPVRTAKFDLTLKLEEEEGGGLAGMLEYNTDVFTAATMGRLARHWLTLLGGLAADPDRRLSQLPLLGAGELRLRAAQWHPATAGGEDAAGAPPPPPLVHELIALRAAGQPHAPAVEAGEERLSYGELDAAANRLAHHLRSLGVATDDRVALVLERSAALVVALLAVLKAGAAYVPLDPGLPAERLAVMLRDAEPAALITVERFLDRLPPVLACQLVLLDADAAEIAAANAGAPPPLALPESLAYVIYTSGSSGVPKGVAVPHRALAGYVRDAGERLGLGACARFALVSTFAADLGHTVLFPALTGGGCLVVVGSEQAADAEALGELLGEAPADCLKIVPSHLAALLLGRRPERVLPRRCLVLGGEGLDGGLVRRVRALAPRLEVFNHYGPTETTVGVITHQVTADPPAGTAVPLTAPLPGVAIHLLDRAGEPVPAAVVGEVCVAGGSLARGYLGRPDATAAVFLPDPFAGRPGARLYRTGDLAALRDDGALEILGRADRQVKVRGYRVELGEIEALLGRHPAVAQAVAALAGDAASGRRLVAYVVGREGVPPPLDELRRHLAERLPDYMVPRQLVALAALPLTPNGKLDRAALSEPPAAAGLPEPAAAAAGEAVASPVEEVLCGIWAQVLGVRRVGVGDNFFDLGGHSVLATQVVARIEEALQIQLPLLSLFELPTVAGLARRIEMTMKGGSGLRLSVPGPVPRQAEMPLSYAQQRLWFLHQLEPDSAAYNMAGMVRAAGRLDAAAFARSLAEIVRRHEVLRTTFHKVAGRPALRIHPPLAPAVPMVDLAGLPASQREAEERRLAQADARRPFDLALAPLLRTTLLRLGTEEHLLLLTMHHIVSDGWSVGIILRELSILYEGFVHRRSVGLPELPLQYADYAVWQRQWLQGEALDAQLGYWRRQLAGLPPVLALPTDRPHPPLQTFRGARISFTLDLELVERLEQRSREQDATLFMTLLAVFAALLGRYAGQRDLALGSPIAGRNHLELEGLVGFFVNTLVLRARPAPELGFDRLLAQVRETALGAYAHQDLPFEHLVETLAIERDLARPPIFQTMFVWQNIPTPLARLSGLALTPLEGDTRSAKFELTLALQQMRESMLGSLEYNSDLFDAATVERMAGHFRNLLAAVAAEPASRLGDLAWMSAVELQQVAGLWGSPAPAAGAGAGAAGFCARLAAQAERTPLAVAARHGESSLTYAELGRRTDRLARHLAAAGAGPEVLVAIAAERGIDLLVAIVAVLEAGAAYLPLEPRQPVPRQLEILARSGAALLLASAAAAELQAAVTAEPAPAGARPRLLVLEEALTAAGGQDAPPGAAAAPESLAYVIYTSGSTGLPKGAMIERRGMLNHLLAKVGELALGPGDVVAQTASQCFDVSVWQYLAALLVGARVEILDDAVAHDPARLLAELERRGVTVCETVPPLLQLLLEASERRGDAGAGLARLRWLIVTGEALPAALCRRWLDRYPHVPLLNAYGPTECSDDVSHHRIAAPPGENARVPIGRPVANLRLYVLDAELAPLPLGVAGELCVGGVGVGRGYRGDAAQTALSFAPDPRGGAGARLYRTGDRARLRPDGALEFLGRRDDQVKIRGFRVEPGEIEAALLLHPEVREAAVIAHDDAVRGGQLVAFLVARRAGALDGAGLRAFLQQSLPDYMVPAVFLPLERLPLGATGKLDRRALAALAVRAAGTRGSRGVGEPGGVAPRSLLELQLIEIWQEALGVPRLGITDDFFALGGHSLLAVRLMVLIDERLGIALPLSSLFRGPTVEHLAHLIATRQQDQLATLWSPLVPIQPGGWRPPLYCVHPTGGDVLCYHPLARLLGPEQPLYGLQAQGLDASRPPLGDIPEMAACYLAAIRAVQPHGPYHLAGWSFGGVVAYEIAQQLAGAGETVALLAIFDSLAPVGATAATATPLSRAQWASWFAFIAREFESVFRQSLELPPEELAALPPEEQLHAFVARLRRVEFLPPGAGLSLAESFWRVHEANTMALWRYAAAAQPYGGPVTLFRSAEPLLLDDSWDRDSHSGPDLGWARLCGGTLAVEEVPGNHNTLLQAPHVEVLAGRLAAGLARAVVTASPADAEARRERPRR